MPHADDLLPLAPTPTRSGTAWRPTGAGSRPITYQPARRPATAIEARPSVRVATLLAPDERARFDAAAVGRCTALHRDDVGALVLALRAAPGVGALVVSTAALLSLGAAGAARIGALARAFPAVRPLVLVSEARGAPELLLVLGRYGVERVVDVREPTGWRHLRDTLDMRAGEEVAALVGELVDSGTLTPRVGAFLDTLLSLPPAVATVRMLADGLGLPPTTLTSRFRRAGLPSPKRYLAFARLVRAARLLEQPGRSLAATALALDYSSAQSFGRHVQTLLGLPAAEFRRSHDARTMLALLCRDLVLPHVAVLERLDGGRIPRSAAA